MDKNFWEQYYSINKEPFQPSSFAREVIQNISKNSTLLDVGCGNGRDSIFFANNSIKTTGIDQSETVIKNLKKYENSHLIFRVDDINNLKEQKYDYAYCRFLLHSLNENEEDALLAWIKGNISKKIFVESRVDIDKEKYEKTTHYRRLMNIDKFCKKLELYQFKIEGQEISDKFSIYENKYNVSDVVFNPMLIRLIISK